MKRDPASSSDQAKRACVGDDGVVARRSAAAIESGVAADAEPAAGGGLSGAGDGSLKSARYRNTPAFRTLNLTLEQSSDAASFPDDIWSPPGAGR